MFAWCHSNNGDAFHLFRSNAILSKWIVNRDLKILMENHNAELNAEQSQHLSEMGKYQTGSEQIKY